MDRGDTNKPCRTELANPMERSRHELTQRQQQEENFLARPSVRMVFPDHIKSILVDDWENVTKNLQVVRLPCEHTVNGILDDYFAHENQQRRAGSAEADILEEFVQGMRDYFEKCLGKILLYRFERDQFFEVRGWWEGSSDPEHENVKGPADVYGAEHLARLFGESCLLSIKPRSFRPFLKPPSISEKELFSNVRNSSPPKSGHARTHRANQHGCPIGSSSPRRTRSHDSMARAPRGHVLRFGLRTSDAGIHRQGPG